MAKFKRALVTGGAGFIGSQLVRELLDTGAEVTVVDNLVNGKAANLEGLDLKRAKLATLDIRARDSIRALLAETDIVFHLACLGVRHSLHAPRENHDVNATATLDLLEDARAAKVARFVYVSSSEVYGTARRAPMTEEHPTYPLTVYGAGKLAGECYTRAYWESWRYPTIVVRPFNAYGPRCHHEGDSGEVIPKFMLRAMAGRPMIIFGDGTQTRDFNYVADTARGILLAGTVEAAAGQTINIGSGVEISINEIAETISQLTGRNTAMIQHDAPRPGDVLRLIADTSRARAMLDYEPRVSLAAGLELLKNWYLSSPKSVEEMLADERTHNWQPSGANDGS